jgi:hypothetical protein
MIAANGLRMMAAARPSAEPRKMPTTLPLATLMRPRRPRCSKRPRGARWSLAEARCGAGASGAGLSHTERSQANQKQQASWQKKAKQT